MQNNAGDHEEADKLVLEFRGWAESIARSVARAWNLDWELDGLDGAAMEALIFCSRRFDPAMGVPFKGYARKRIHEASCEAARKCRGWRSGSKTEVQAREISAELLNIFPELRMGELPMGEGSDGDTRSAVRQLLVGASLLAVKDGLTTESNPEEAMDFKRMVERIATLDPIHQSLLWKVYWEGASMRNVAVEWETDELNVIREHKVILDFLQKSVGKPVSKSQNIKVRPGLKQIALKLKKKAEDGEFSKLVAGRKGAR